MIKRITKLALALGTISLMPIMAEAQVLEQVPDMYSAKAPTYSEEMENGALPEYHLGSTFSGSSGLVSIQTPDYNDVTKVGVSVKHSNTDFKMTVAGKKLTHTKDETLTSIRYYPKPELEISIVDLQYKRKNDGNISALSKKQNLIGAGLKYTAGHDGKNYCFGFNFAPMSTEKMNNCDIEQIENMRNLYFTFSEEFDRHFHGYITLGMSFTKDQKIEINPFETIELDRKNIVYGGLGIEYVITDNIRLFGEYKVANYRDFEAYDEKPNRHRAHIGARFGNEKFEVEVMGKNITGKEPTLVLGANVGF